MRQNKAKQNKTNLKKSEQNRTKQNKTNKQANKQTDKHPPPPPKQTTNKQTYNNFKIPHPPPPCPHTTLEFGDEGGGEGTKEVEEGGGNGNPIAVGDTDEVC